MADNSRCTECDGVMKDNDIKCVQCSLCQNWVHLECFVMAAGLDEALFQWTKVDPTKNKRSRGQSMRLHSVMCYSDLQALPKWRRCREDYHQVI